MHFLRVLGTSSFLISSFLLCYILVGVDHGVSSLVHTARYIWKAQLEKQSFRNFLVPRLTLVAPMLGVK